MDTLTCQQTQTSNFSDQNSELDSDEESYTSIREIIGLFPGKKNSDAYDHQSQDMDGIDVQSSDDNEHQSQDMERIDVQRPDINEDQKEGMDRIDVQTSETSHGGKDKETLEQEESFSLLDTTLGQQDTSVEESSIENMSIDTADKYQIKFVASGTTPEPFEYIPWKIQLNEGNGIHATLHEEVIAVLDGEATTKEIFSPFHNRSYQEFHSYLGENNFFFDSLDRIARLPKEKVLKNDKALQFMAFFVHDFVMDFRQNCVKHKLLHQGDKEKYSISTVRRWFGGEDNGQLEGLVQCLENDIKCNEEDEHTDFCLKQVSRYSFNYNEVRKRMYDLCTASEIAQFPIVTFGVGSVALSLVREGKEDLLSIFYFACHHYSVFGEEFIQLLKKRHFLIPQLLSERYGKLTVVQLLVYDGDHVHPKATRAVKFDEGIYVSHLFCPFLLHPMLEQKSYRKVEYNQEVGKVWRALDARISAHSCMIVYWHYTYFHYEDLHPCLEVNDLEEISTQSNESDNEEGSSRLSKGGFCCNLKDILDREKIQHGYNRVYLTCYGDANGSELTYYGEEKLYVMEYNSHCLLSIFDDDGEVEDLRGLRADDLDFHDGKYLNKK